MTATSKNKIARFLCVRGSFN